MTWSYKLTLVEDAANDSNICLPCMDLIMIMVSSPVVFDVLDT